MTNSLPFQGKVKSTNTVDYLCDLVVFSKAMYNKGLSQDLPQKDALTRPSLVQLDRH